MKKGFGGEGRGSVGSKSEKYIGEGQCINLICIELDPDTRHLYIYSVLCYKIYLSVSRSLQNCEVE